LGAESLTGSSYGKVIIHTMYFGHIYWRYCILFAGVGGIDIAERKPMKDPYYLDKLEISGHHVLVHERRFQLPLRLSQHT